MNIYLCKINGISYEDTPFFSSKKNQYDYFDDNLVVDIDSAYYPPKYKNSIKIDVSDDNGDITVASNINYLWIIYLNKRYFYFIDRIEYVSETTIILHVTLDVIQTYMFDIDVVSGIIERKMINRWKLVNNEWKINRNYIRENFSSNNFEKLDYYIEINDNQKYGQLPISIYFGYIGSVYKTLKSSYSYFIAPYFPTHVSPDSDNIYTDLCNLGYVSECVDIYVCPFNPFSDNDLNGPVWSGTKWYWNYRSGAFTSYNMDYASIGYGDSHWALLMNGGLPVITPRRYDGNLPFSKNDTLNNTYSSSYITSLLDENYINVEFGSYNTSLNYSLYRLETPVIKCHYTFDFSNGCRIYSINRTNNFFDTEDRVITTDNNILSVDLLNDAWKEYISNNKNRWAQIVNQNITGTGSSMVSMTAKYGGGGAALGLGKGMVESSGNIINQLYTEDNIKHMPGSAKQIGELNTTVSSKSGIIFYSYTKAQDFEKCALHYHMYGNKVNEVVTDHVDVFSYVNTRYYFNYVKFSELNVHLNMLESFDDIDKISERLINGIRLWNVEQNVVIGTYKYDNVEKDFL